MRRKLGSVLLCGVILMAGPLMAMAQTAPAASGVQPKYPLDIAVPYSATLSNAITGNSFWMQGGSVQVHGQFYRGLGVVADVAGMHEANIHASGVGLDMVTATFGPRYTWQPAHHRYALFGQALVGTAFAFNTVIPIATGPATNSDTSLAVQVGGGVNLRLSPRFSLRALDADWLRTQMSNSTTNVQNNIRLGAGVDFRFR